LFIKADAREGERMKIYLSSTYEDLKDHRRTVFDALRQSGYQVIAMEVYVARDERPVNACLKDVAESDIYVGIFGLRYGYEPPPEHNNPDGLSITELEFRQADNQDTTDCLTFLLNEDEALPPKKYIDALSGENERGERIKGLRDHLQKVKTARFFSYSTPHELASLVQTAVAKYAQERGADRPSDEAPSSIPSESMNQWRINQSMGSDSIDPFIPLPLPDTRLLVSNRCLFSIANTYDE
jgi:hypothetical protein